MRGRGAVLSRGEDYASSEGGQGGKEQKSPSLRKGESGRTIHYKKEREIPESGWGSGHLFASHSHLGTERKKHGTEPNILGRRTTGTIPHRRGGAQKNRRRSQPRKGLIFNPPRSGHEDGYKRGEKVVELQQLEPWGKKLDYSIGCPTVGHRGLERDPREKQRKMEESLSGGEGPGLKTTKGNSLRRNSLKKKGGEKKSTWIKKGFDPNLKGEGKVRNLFPASHKIPTSGPKR